MRNLFGILLFLLVLRADWVSTIYTLFDSGSKIHIVNQHHVQFCPPSFILGATHFPVADIVQ